MPRTVRQIFQAIDSITIPSGVSYVKVTPIFPKEGLNAFGNLTYFKTPYNQLYGAGGPGPFGGALGDNTLVQRSSPVLIAGNYTFTKLVSNWSAPSTINALTNSGQIYSWGQNTNGALGVTTIPTAGTAGTASSPVLVSSTLSFCQIANGADFITYALTPNGFLYWFGILDASGTGLTSGFLTASSPTLITTSTKISRILWANSEATYVQDHTGRTFGIGSNYKGFLGTGAASGGSSIPVLVAGAGAGGYKFVKIGTSTPTSSTNTRNAFGLTSDGKLYGWGSNEGYLGTGNANAYSSPVLIASNVIDCSAFYPVPTLCQTNAYIDANNNAYIWGNNQNGRLGLNSNPTIVASISSPVLLSNTLKFTKIVFNDNVVTAFGLTTTGDLYAWGFNQFGNLGDGSLLDKSTPTIVVGGYKFVDFKIGHSAQVYGITREGAIYAWGSQFAGELGINTSVICSSPTLIVGPYGVNGLGQTGGYLTYPATTIINVTPNTTYDIILSSSTSYFGTTPISFGEIEKIVVEYEL